MNPVVALVGAETALGEAILELFAKRDFPGERIIPLVPDPADAGLIVYGESSLRPQAVDEFDFSRVGISLIADPQASSGWLDSLAASGNIVVNCFSQEEAGSPLVAEVNGRSLEADTGDILNLPTAAAQFLAILAKPLSELGSIRRISVCSHYPAIYQGQAGVEELAGQTARLLNGIKPEPARFPKQVAFNLSAQISAEEGGTGIEETRIANQIRKILGDPSISVSATCIQVGVFYALSQVVEIEFAEEVALDAVNSRLKKAPGLKVSPRGNSASATDDKLDSQLLHVGRIRQESGNNRQITLWCTGDYLRRGLGLNAVQIAEILIKGYS